MALTVYKQIAKDALMSWNGLSEEEATKVVQESSNEELESQVYAQGSIDAAIKGFQKYSQEYLKNKNGYEQPISEQDMETFKEIIMTGDYRNGSTNDFFETVKKQMGLGRENTDEKQIAEDTRDMVISVLSTIHDGWVHDNQKKFFARDKKYQHMPIELIGWKEVKSDLLFLKPILEAMDLSAYISEEDLEKAYNQRVQAFLEEKGITDIDKLSEQISRGAEFYPALEGQDDITQALQDTEFVKQQVVSGIKDKGIGTNERFAQQLFSEKANNGKSVQDLGREAIDIQEETSYIDKTQEDLEREQKTIEDKDKNTQEL